MSIQLGQVFYELTIISDIPIYKNNKIYLLCKCSCGNIKEIRKDNLIGRNQSRLYKSCGCKKTIKRSHKKRRESSMYSTLYRNCKSNSKSRKINFNLSEEQHFDIIVKNCYYCGSPPKVGQRVGKNKSMVGLPVHYNGVDRLNSDVGYIKENCVPCCEMCNKMKLNNTVENFMNKVLEIYNHKNL